MADCFAGSTPSESHMLCTTLALTLAPGRALVGTNMLPPVVGASCQCSTPTLLQGRLRPLDMLSTAALTTGAKGAAVSVARPRRVRPRDRPRSSPKSYSLADEEVESSPTEIAESACQVQLAPAPVAKGESEPDEAADASLSLLESFAARATEEAAVTSAFASQLSEEDAEVTQLRRRHSLAKVRYDYLTDGEDVRAVSDAFASHVGVVAPVTVASSVDDQDAQPEAPHGLEQQAPPDTSKAMGGAELELSKELWKDVEQAAPDTSNAMVGLTVAALVGVTAVDAITAMGITLI